MDFATGDAPPQRRFELRFLGLYPPTRLSDFGMHGGIVLPVIEVL
jgi:hypothetical protein